MKVDNFSLIVEPGKEDKDGYVTLEHETKYTIILGNHSRKRCNVYIEIDGESVGAWRIEAWDTIELKRPSHDSGHFTFYKVASSEGKAIGLDKVDRTRQGLISARFVPEFDSFKQPKSVERSALYKDVEDFDDYENYRSGGRAGGCGAGTSRSRNLNSYSAGGTGLQGDSGQRFGVASRIKENLNNAVTINLRLVASREEPRPLKQRSNPIPPPV